MLCFLRGSFILLNKCFEVYESLPFITWCFVLLSLGIFFFFFFPFFFPASVTEMDRAGESTEEMSGLFYAQM